MATEDMDIMGPAFSDERLAVEWAAAKARCIAEGGHFIEIHDGATFTHCTVCGVRINIG